jgi:hypothetical protein
MVGKYTDIVDLRQNVGNFKTATVKKFHAMGRNLFQQCIMKKETI